MISSKSILLSCLLALASLSLIGCDVDESKPDLRMFHLRPVDAVRQTQERLRQPIRDYANGAIMMRKALFSSNPKVRCSTYAHLLKMIHNAESNGGKEVQQDTVIALAIAVDYESKLYGELFKTYQPVVLQESFKDAIEKLERRPVTTPLSRDTWMELIDCAVQFELNLDSFLGMPTRAAKIENYLKFKETRGANSPEETPVNVFREAEILEAIFEIESFDDDDLGDLKDDLRDPPPQSAKPEETMPHEDVSNNQDAPPDSGKIIDIEVPELDESEAYFDEMAPALVEGHMHVLNFLRHRVEILESMPKERVDARFKLSPDSAVDFVTTWNILKKLKLNPKEPVASRVAKYLNDERNVRVFNRMHKSVANFKQITEYLAKIKRNEGHWKTMQELEKTYEDLIKVLNEVDFLEDIYDISRAALNTRARELKEFQTMNKFIEGDFW